MKKIESDTKNWQNYLHKYETKEETLRLIVFFSVRALEFLDEMESFSLQANEETLISILDLLAL